ncbi:MAG TPA: cysteine--tRNA ligase [Acidimicrobiales bacterium]|nr:cysteine--tRNA ligase [Acidimicrobiales bacterium]
MLRLYDTALGTVAPLEPRDPGRLSMYVCGPTVYDEPHVGHGRFTVTWDVLRRYAAWSGLDVNFVSNVTDIEDKIIAKAAAERRSTEQVAEQYEKLWWDTQDRLGVLRPDEIPHATAYVDDMVELIKELVDSGHAYVGGDGVYFSSESIDGYGLLARQPIDSLRAGARVEVGEEAGKRSPIDFVLWKLAKPGEPSWPSPWGPGRPGWHTECVVMSLDLLGEGFDLHGGGLDLAFPHHENERAQAVGAGRAFARRWVHSGMVTSEGGEKMSKSLGNTLSLLELLDAYDPRAFRLLVLQSHYRSPLEVTESSLAAAGAGVERLDAFAREFSNARGKPADRQALDRFRDRMDDDLDTPGAVAGAFELLREARSASGEDAVATAAAVFEIFEQALGLPLRDVVEAAPAEALDKAAERDRARAAKDWARADELRAELQADGWIVEDGPDGTTIRR